jgi:hypothetical protein
MRIDGELVGVGSFGAQVACADGTIGIALNIDEFTALAEDELPATDGAIRTNALSDMGAAQSRRLRQRLYAERFLGSFWLPGEWEAEHSIS